MDADEELKLDDNFNKNLFKQALDTSKPDQLVINCIYGGMRYNRAQFFNFKSDYYWYGPVHEVIMTNKPNPRIEEFPFGHTKITPDGNSWQTDDLSKKYEDHANILLQYQKDNNWNDPRWTFYLAQSYRDAANIVLLKTPNDERGVRLCNKSIQYYDERVNAKGGFNQEIYYSQLSLSRLSYHTSTNEFVMHRLLKCEELNVDKRVEHLFNLCSFLQTSQLHKNALIYLKLALKYIKEGTKSNLFIESYIYDWAVYDMYGISLFYTGDIENALKYFNYALKKINDGNARDTDIERVKNNIKSAESELQRRRDSSK